MNDVINFGPLAGPLLRRVGRNSLALASLLALAACGQKSDAPAPTGQWVAKVNEREITVHQVNAEMNGLNAGALPAAAAQRRVVDSLVERRLLVDAAAKTGAERTPEVLLAIEKAKEQIIAQHYLRQTVGAPKKPSAAEVSEYFKQHPALFAERKQYDMRQLVVETAQFTDEVKRKVDTAATLDEVEAALSAANIKFAKGRTLRTSAEMPAPMLGKLEALSSGKPFVVRAPANVVIATMSFVKDVPVTQQEATPQIEQYLANASAQKAASAEIARLRKEAKLEYKPGYGPDTATAAAGANTAAVDRAAVGLR